MRYMLLMCRDEARWEAVPEREKGAIVRQVEEFIGALRTSGVLRAGDPLEPVATATTLRLEGGRVVMTEGPFAETTEQLGGYNIVEAENLDEVLALAARHPLLRVGYHAIEVRPIREWPPR